MRLQLFVYIFVLCLAMSSQAEDFNPATCSQANVQAAIDSAADGDRVLVPAGSCTWSSQVLIPNTKGITLQGAGIDITTITDGFTTDDMLQLNLAPGNSLVDINGFTFDANGVIKTGARGEIAFTGGGLNSFRIHHVKLLNLRTRGITQDGNGSEISGLIDHCTLEDLGDFQVQGISMIADGPEARGNFARSFDLGSGDFIFIEDCLFDYTFDNDGSIDAFSGARYVFRHNTVRNSNVSHHGADSGGRAGIHSFEIYENTIVNTGANLARALFFRSGSGVVYNNTITGNYTAATVMAVSNFRSRPQDFPPWGACDGTSPWDENVAGESGWACLDQIGHIFGVSSGGSNTLEGLYEWNNTLNGADFDFSVAEATMENHLQEGRDFFSDTERPGYTPFTYPHPLQGEEGVGATVSGSVTLSGAVTIQ